MHKVIDYDAVCESCDGTGLYVGMAEKDGAAVVCHTCNGTGCDVVHIEYDEFEQRQKHESAEWVYQAGMGYVLAKHFKDRDAELSEWGGMSYEDWSAGKPFPPKSEDRQRVCPANWYQNTDRSKKPEWDRCSTSWGDGFSHCANFGDKAKCWLLWDEEFGDEEADNGA